MEKKTRDKNHGIQGRKSMHYEQIVDTRVLTTIHLESSPMAKNTLAEPLANRFQCLNSPLSKLDLLLESTALIILAFELL